MLPAAFARLVHVGAEVLGELASQIGPLGALLKQASKAATPSGAFLKFRALLRQIDPTISWADVRQRYYAAKYFTDQKDYLPAWPKDIRLDPRVAELVPTGTGLGPQGELFRYRTDLAITFPGTGDLVHFYVWVGSDEHLTPGEIQDLAEAQLFSAWKPKSRPKSAGGEGPELWVTSSMVSFERFIARGVI